VKTGFLLHLLQPNNVYLKKWIYVTST